MPIVAAYAAGSAGGQVDLTQQKDENEAHGEDDDRCGLGDEVSEVGLGQELVADVGEDDHQHDQADQCGQRADLAAAHPLDVVDEGLFERAGSDILAEVSRREAGGGFGGRSIAHRNHLT
jgi:hypothetical protein